jgi:cell division protein ZapA (FtsZ GTPase activity inhibitor)
MRLLAHDAEARRAQVELLALVLEEVRQACVFGDDDGGVGVSEDVVIPAPLFERICTALNPGTPAEQVLEQAKREWRTVEHMAGIAETFRTQAEHARWQVEHLRDEMTQVLASLAAALSLLERGGKQAAASDKMFEQMMRDYSRSLSQARSTLRKMEDLKEETTNGRQDPQDRTVHHEDQQRQRRVPGGPAPRSGARAQRCRQGIGERAAPRPLGDAPV